MSLVTYTDTFDESSPVGQDFLEGTPADLRNQILGRLNVNAYFPFMLDTRTLPCIYKRYDILSNITIGENNGGDEQLLIVADLMANQDVLGYAWARTVNGAATTPWSLVTEIKISGSLDKFEQTRITGSFLTLRSNTITTTNTNLSGTVTSITIQKIPNEIDYATLSSYAPLPQQKVVNTDLSKGVAAVAWPCIQDFTYSGCTDPEFAVNLKPYISKRTPIFDIAQPGSTQDVELDINQNHNWFYGQGKQRFKLKNVWIGTISGGNVDITINTYPNDHFGEDGHVAGHTFYNVSAGSEIEFTPRRNHCVKSLSVTYHTGSYNIQGFVEFELYSIDKVFQPKATHFKTLMFVQGSVGRKNINISGGASYECLPTLDVSQQVTPSPAAGFNPVPNDVWKKLYEKGMIRLVYDLPLYIEMIDQLRKIPPSQFSAQAAHVVGEASLLGFLRPFLKALYSTIRPTIPGLVENGLKFTDKVMDGWASALRGRASNITGHATSDGLDDDVQEFFLELINVRYGNDGIWLDDSKWMQANASQLTGEASSRETPYEPILPTTNGGMAQYYQALNDGTPSLENFELLMKRVTSGKARGILGLSAEKTVQPSVYGQGRIDNSSRGDAIIKEWFGMASGLTKDQLYDLYLSGQLSNLNLNEPKNIITQNDTSYAEVPYDALLPSVQNPSISEEQGVDEDTKVIRFDPGAPNAKDVVGEVREKFKAKVKKAEAIGYYDLFRQSIKQQMCLSTAQMTVNINTVRVAPFMMVYKDRDGVVDTKACFIMYSYFPTQEGVIYRSMDKARLRPLCAQYALDKSATTDRYDLSTGILLRPGSGAPEFKALIKSDRFLLDPRLYELFSTPEGTQVWLNFLIEPLTQQVLKSDPVLLGSQVVTSTPANTYLTLIEPPGYERIPLSGNSFTGALNQLVSGRDPSLVYELGARMAPIFFEPAVTYDSTADIYYKYKEMDRLNTKIQNYVEAKLNLQQYPDDVAELRKDPGYAYAKALQDSVGLYLTMVNYRTPASVLQKIEAYDSGIKYFSFNTLEGVRIGKQNYNRNSMTMSTMKTDLPGAVYRKLANTTPTFLMISSGPNDIFQWRSTLWNLSFSKYFPRDTRTRLTLKNDYMSLLDAERKQNKDDLGDEIFSDQQYQAYLRSKPISDEGLDLFFQDNKDLMNFILKHDDERGITEQEWKRYAHDPSTQLTTNSLEGFKTEMNLAKKALLKNPSMDLEQLKAFRWLNNVINFKANPKKDKTLRKTVPDYVVSKSKVAKPVQKGPNFRYLFEAMKPGTLEDVDKGTN